MFCRTDISYRHIWMKFIKMLSVHAQSGTHRRFQLMNYCSFNIEPFCSDVCGDHRRPQTLAEICRNMGICCGFRAVAAREKYPGFMLLKKGLFLQLWSTWTLVINFQILSLGNTWRDNIVSFDKDSWERHNQSWARPTLVCQVCLAKHLSAHSTEVLSHAHHVSSGGNFKQHQVYFDRPPGGIVPSSGQFGSSCILLSMFTPCKRLKPAWVYLSLNFTWHRFMATDLILLITHVKKNRKRREQKKKKKKKTKYAV